MFEIRKKKLPFFINDSAFLPPRISKEYQLSRFSTVCQVNSTEATSVPEEDI